MASTFAKNFKFIIIDYDGDIIGGADTEVAAEEAAKRFCNNNIVNINTKSYTIAEIKTVFRLKFEVNVERKS